jgi:hypothetical protein
MSLYFSCDSFSYLRTNSDYYICSPHNSDFPKAEHDLFSQIRETTKIWIAVEWWNNNCQMWLEIHYNFKQRMIAPNIRGASRALSFEFDTSMEIWQVLLNENSFGGYSGVLKLWLSHCDLDEAPTRQLSTQFGLIHKPRVKWMGWMRFEFFSLDHAISSIFQDGKKKLVWQRDWLCEYENHAEMSISCHYAGMVWRSGGISDQLTISRISGE